MSKEKRRVPKLRFPGFTEDWEQRKLNEFLSVSNFKNTDNKYNKNNVLSVSGDYGIVNQIEFQGRSFAGVSVSNYGVVETGDIVYTKSPLKLNPYGIIKANRINAGIVSTLYAIYKTKKNCDSKFIEHYFNLDSRLNKYLKPLVNKGAKNDMKVSSENALIGEVCFPHVTEQKLIADFLDRLDLFITLHQRKLEHLNLKKKALLQKLFPKNGERYPEIRFPGFTDAWEQCKLGDLAEIVRGASPRPISDPKWFDNDSNVGWLRIADVTAQDGRIRYLEQKISELGQEKTRVIKTPHLLLSIAATVGKPVINYVPTGVHDGFLIFLNPKFNILYAFWWLEMFREKWNKYGQPGSQVNLNSDLVKNQVINIPNEKEQEKISSFLESLDKIITLHQRKLEHLQLQKKALLQQMFV